MLNTIEKQLPYKLIVSMATNNHRDTGFKAFVGITKLSAQQNDNRKPYILYRNPVSHS